MKRKLSLIIALSLLLSLCLAGCGGSGKTGEIAGYYKCISLTVNGEEDGGYAMLSEYGFYTYLVLEEDGTGYSSTMGERAPLQWDARQIWDEGDDEKLSATPYTYRDGTITVAQDDQQMVYEKLAGDELEDYKQNGDPDTDEITDRMLSGIQEDAKSLEEASGDVPAVSEEFLVAFADVREIIAEIGGGEFTGASSQDLYEDDWFASSEESEESYKGNDMMESGQDSYATSAGSHEDAGYYEIVYYEEDGEQYHRNTLEEYGINFDMMLYEDGTGYAHFMGDYYDLTWQDGSIDVDTDDGVETLTYTTANLGRKHIYIEDDISRMTFEYAGETD